MVAVLAGLTLRLPSPTVELDDPRIARHGLRLFLKRDDLIHPDLPGNKWRKLKHNLAEARARGHHQHERWEPQDERERRERGRGQGRTTLLTFGGAYSNHIRATAAAGRHFGFDTVGVIRGEEHLPLNESLAYAVSQGMRLTYLDRATYRRKTEPDVVGGLRERFGDFFMIPEGGGNSAGVRGCAELPAEIDVPYDVICCACGTGTTLAGISAGLPQGRRALGFSVLKGGRFLDQEVSRLQHEAYGAVFHNWSIDCGFHFGGFARRTPELDDFIEDFKERHGLRLDRVYVAKMMYGLFALVERGEFPRDTRIAAVVTG